MNATECPRARLGGPFETAGATAAMGASSAALLLFSFPPYDMNFFAFAALVPVLLVVYTATPARALAAGAVCGFLFFSLHLFWVNAYLPVVGVAFVTVVYGGCVAVCLFALNLAARAFPSFMAPLTPFAWGAVEYGRSLGFLGTTFGSIGYTQHGFPALIQTADIGGEPLVGFIVVSFNAGLAHLIVSALAAKGESSLRLPGARVSRPAAWTPRAPRSGTCAPKDVRPGSRAIKRRPSGQYVSFAAPSALLAAALLYGAVRLREPLPEGPSVKLALIQALSSPRATWKSEKWETLTRLIALSEESIAAHPDVDIVVWTETAIRTSLGPNLERGDPYHVQIRDFVKRHKRGFIIGSPDAHVPGGSPENGRPADPYTLEEVRPPVRGSAVWTNSAYYLGPDGAIVGKYDKIKLTPFGEHFPLGRRVPPLGRFLDLFTDSADFTPGKEYTVFRLGAADFSVVICWEGMYPYLVRRFVLEGARFVVNISNDMWTKSEAAHEQHFIAAKFRAVENRIWFVRAGNDGVTAFVDPRGVVRGRLPVGEPGFLVGEAGPKGRDTFYTRNGDILPKLCIAVFALSLAASIPSFAGRRAG